MFPQCYIPTFSLPKMAEKRIPRPLIVPIGISETFEVIHFLENLKRKMAKIPTRQTTEPEKMPTNLPEIVARVFVRFTTLRTILT